MKKSDFKKKELRLLLGLIVLAIVLLAFKSRKVFSNSHASFFDQVLSYNRYFQQLPEKYQRVVEDEPVDIVLSTDEVYVEKMNNLKYNAHFVQNDIYREVVLIKKVTPNDTLIEDIRLDVYPANRKHLKRKYITYYKLNNVRYSHNKANYLVARQVIPNIEIYKIVPYTKQWKTAILSVDNSILLTKNNDQNNAKEFIKKDSLSIGLGTKTSVYGFLFGKALQENDISYLSLDENLKKDDVLSSSELFKSYLNKNNLKLVRISDDISFWENLTQLKKVQELHFLNNAGVEIVKKLETFLSGDQTFESIFDIEKLAAYYALLNLYSNRTENNLYLKFNENTELLEPFFIERPLGELNTYIKDLKIHDIDFLEEYRARLASYAELDAAHSFIEDNRVEIKEILEEIHQNEPYQLFDERTFLHNKLIIEKALNPSTSTKIALTQYDENHMELEVENLTYFPLELLELSYKENKFIVGPRGASVLIMPGEKRKVIFDLPDSFDNLFVQKKKKTTGFVFEKDIFDLSIGYRFVGMNGITYNTITPFADLDSLEKDDDLFRSESNLSKFEFIAVDSENKAINIASDSIVLNKPLVLPAGYTINANAGLQIDIMAGGKIISKSPLNFKGSEENPIKVYSSDGKGQGIFVVSAKETSELKYVEFDNLTNQAHGLWDLTGAVVFYESPVNLDHVLIANNSCEDGLNIIRTHFTMKNTTFRNTQSDAFDGDFVQGTLTNCIFENLGNDAIDVSGSSLEMYDLKVVNAGDKALSAGEDSEMKAERIIIDRSEIAIAGKDLSIVQINDATITNSKLGFTAFQKKPEFGASSITAKNVTMTQVETPYLIENRSSLLLNGEQADTIEEVMEQMYGVEFGVDSKETRFKKTQ